MEILVKGHRKQPVCSEDIIFYQLWGLRSDLFTFNQCHIIIIHWRILSLETISVWDIVISIGFQHLSTFNPFLCWLWLVKSLHHAFCGPIYPQTVWYLDIFWFPRSPPSGDLLDTSPPHGPAVPPSPSCWRPFRGARASPRCRAATGRRCASWKGPRLNSSYKDYIAFITLAWIFLKMTRLTL